MSCQHGRPMGRYAGYNVVGDLLGEPMLPLRIPWYVTVLDLGPAGAVYTEGWDRPVVRAGREAKATKQTINTQRIYPPLTGNRCDAGRRRAHTAGPAGARALTPPGLPEAGEPRPPRPCETPLVLDAVEPAIWSRGPPPRGRRPAGTHRMSARRAVRLGITNCQARRHDPPGPRQVDEGPVVGARRSVAGLDDLCFLTCPGGDLDAARLLPAVTGRVTVSTPF